MKRDGNLGGTKVENESREKKLGKNSTGVSPPILSPFPRLRIPGPRSRALIRAITPAHVLPYVSALINTRDDGEEGPEEGKKTTNQAMGRERDYEARESGTLKQIYRA